jgi:hypothetical protein
MTSFAFMFVDVPAPPWIMSTTKCSWWRPARISCDARLIGSAIAESSRPSSSFDVATAFLDGGERFVSAGNSRSAIPVIGSSRAPATSTP